MQCMLLFLTRLKLTDVLINYLFLQLLLLIMLRTAMLEFGIGARDVLLLFSVRILGGIPFNVSDLELRKSNFQVQIECTTTPPNNDTIQLI